MLSINKMIKIAVITSSLFLTAQVSAEENTMNNEPSKKLSSILQELNDEGYTKIQDVELEDGVLSVEGANKEGAQFKIKLNPKTGEVIKKKVLEQPKISIIEVVKKFEADGKLSIVEVEFDEGMYKVKAISPDKKEKEFHVDPQTGKTKSTS